MDDNTISDLLSLEYHGPAVELGRMDSYQVAGRIIAFSDFVGVVTKSAFGEKAELRTEIQGIRGESFDIDFYLMIGSFTAHAFSSQPFGIKEYFELFKEAFKAWVHLKGEAPKNITHGPDNSVKIENQDGQIIYVNNSVINIISNAKAGKAAEQFIGKPLEEGVSHLSIKSSTLKESTTIEKKYGTYFKAVDIKTPLITTDVQMGLQIESPTFVEGNKWKFFDGQSPWHADIQDEQFLARVNQGVERFGKGDTLIAIVRLSQTTSISGLKMERSVIKVIKHIEAPQQISLLPD